MMPACPRLGLCSLQTRITNCSDQFGLPVQFLQPCIQFAIPLCELAYFGLQFANRHSRNKSHLRLRITILPCASCLRDSCKEVATLADHIPFGYRIRNRRLFSSNAFSANSFATVAFSRRRMKSRFQLPEPQPSILEVLL